MNKKDDYKQMYFEAIYKIEDAKIQNFLNDCIKLIPEYFWTAFGSFTGKHHPPDENIEGGLILHTLRVFQLCKHLAEMENLKSKEQNLLLASALLHDTFRSGFIGRELRDKKGVIHTDGFHPLYPYWGFEDAVSKYPNEGRSILQIISLHMGRWLIIKLSVDEPELTLGKLLHIADYLASRKNIKIEI